MSGKQVKRLRRQAKEKRERHLCDECGAQLVWQRSMGLPLPIGEGVYGVYTCPSEHTNIISETYERR